MTFGPQNANAVTEMPDGVSKNRYGKCVKTYFKDASAPGMNDATVMDAAFLNYIIASLDYVVERTGVTGDPGDTTILYRALQAIARQT